MPPSNVTALRRTIHARIQQLVADVLSGWASWNLREIEATLAEWRVEPSPKVCELQKQLAALKLAAGYAWLQAKLQLLRAQEEQR